MIWGTSNIWSKSGPVALLTITKMLHKIQENMESSWKKIIYVNQGLKKSNTFKNVCHRYNVFVFLFCFLKVWVHISKIVLRRCGTNHVKFPIKHMCKSLDVNFISIKTWNGHLIFFCFQVRESPNFFIFKEGNHQILISR